jgi:dipeptidyl-peptidase-4
MQKPKFPIEEVARFPSPGMAVPGGFGSASSMAFSPDDSYITYLFSPEGTLVNQLFAFDPQTGQQRLFIAPPEGGTTEENVSPEEALRRERMRLMSQGIPQFFWADKANRILIPLHGDIYVFDAPNGPLRKLVDGGEKPALDPQFSPDGQWVAYVQDSELYVISAEPGTHVQPQQLTWGAREAGLTHGLAEFIAQEEMDRKSGFWWSPDGEYLAFEEVDETHIPIYRIMHQGKDFTGPEAQEDHHYPFAGKENAHVHLGVIPRAGGEPVWMDLHNHAEERYLARVTWTPAGELWVQTENREQTELELLHYNIENGDSQLILTEHTDVWINLNDLLHIFEDGSFIWGSERTGFRHLYLYDPDGTLIRQLTGGEWVIDELAGVDEKNGLVYFVGNRESPLETHLYVISLQGGEPRRVTPEPGTHQVCLDHAFQRFVDTYQTTTQPPTVRLRSIADASALVTIYDKVDPRIEADHIRPAELVSFQNHLGTTLYGALYRPPDSCKPPFATIVYIYGGPHAQLVTDRWGLTVNMRAQYLSGLGYLVFVMDNRGSFGRGLQFEGAIKHHMGTLEIDDQVDGLHWLAEQGLTDLDRVGMYGWSGGGYMTLMGLVRAPDLIKVGVSGAPVTNFDGYDTHFTERYMGTPQSNPEGYRDGSIMPHVENLKGHLMLVHGLIDENVHFRHTARLINALIRARKPYDLLLFPNERHSPRSLADRIYMEERIRDYFLQYLPPEC